MKYDEKEQFMRLGHRNEADVNLAFYEKKIDQIKSQLEFNKKNLTENQKNKNHLSGLIAEMVRDIVHRDSLARKLFLPDQLTPGIPVEYDVLDEKFKAYITHGNDGEAKITPYEGKKCPARLFRIATFPVINNFTLPDEEFEPYLWLDKEEIQELIRQTGDAIVKQENTRVATLLDIATTNYGTKVGGQDDFARVSGLVLPRKSTSNNKMHYKTIASKDADIKADYYIDGLDPNVAFAVPEGWWYAVTPIMYDIDAEIVTTDQKNMNTAVDTGFVIDELIGMLILDASVIRKYSINGKKLLDYS